MKKYILLLVLMVPVWLAAQTNSDKILYLTKSLGSSVNNVEASTSGGSISVSGVTSELRIEVYISGNNNTSLTKEEIKQRLDELYDFDISVTNNKLTATAKFKQKEQDWKKALNIAFKIFVPGNTSTNLKTSGGSISLDNLSGQQTFSTSGGSLHVAKLTGKINGKTSGGSINVQDSKDDIDLTTSGGSIRANNCSGNLRLITSGGSLDLTDLKGTVNASTSGGTVRGKNIEGELKTHTSGGSVHLTDLACSLETSTNGGNIDVAFNSLGKYIKISNSAGNINISLPKNKGLDLDLSGRIGETHFENFNGKIDDNKVKGKLNGGGIPVTADASSGRIMIELK